MKLSAILSSALLAGTALASPLTEARRARHAQRIQARKAMHQGAPMNPDTSGDLILDAGISNDNYSTNWAGPVLVGSEYTSV